MSTPEEEPYMDLTGVAERSRSAHPEWSGGGNGGSGSAVAFAAFDLSLEEASELAEIENDLFVARRIYGYCMTYFHDPPSLAGERAIQRERAYVEELSAQRMKLFKKYAERARPAGASSAREEGLGAQDELASTTRGTPGFGSSHLDDLDCSEHTDSNGHDGHDEDDATIKTDPDLDSDTDIRESIYLYKMFEEHDKKDGIDGNKADGSHTVEENRKRSGDDGLDDKRGSPRRKRKKVVEEAAG
ncbi:hypothetical protein PG996_009233 [Apiospora saccharicola]|uniref:Uncharacterized protein n=1 Tax=Apiospora saccharicola TaxID=335842 RepID=A0ABR1UK73_9PEZI